MASQQSQGGTQVSISSLTLAQLHQVKKQIDDEVEHLATSHAQLRAAQTKFSECARCVRAQAGETDEKNSTSSKNMKKEKGKKEKKEILVPLTNSLYVRGRLADPEHVLIDVGTGFYIENECDSASKFYEEKVKELAGNIQELEGIVQTKSTNLRMIEEEIRGKMLAGKVES